MKQLFQPDGIAVVGASSNPGKAGFVAIRNMREKGYPGKVYPVNPKETEILGYPCSPSLAEVEGHVDLVVLIMPSRMIYSVMDDLDRRMEEKGDVKFIVCAAADYAETCFLPPELIDEINILNASFEGMSLAVARLDPPPEFLAIDGNRFRTRLELPYRCVVKGDGKYADIAAASVLAKTHRDEYMLRLAEEYPQYGWKKNKGYPTREHRLAIREYGLTPHHRLSFSHGIGQLELQF